MRMLAMLTPESCGKDPDYEKLDCTGSLREWNRSLMKMRMRINFRCPKNYPDARFCYRCEMGYGECKAGCHPNTYVLQPCEMCKRDKTFFDFARSDEKCVDCLNQSFSKRR